MRFDRWWNPNLPQMLSIASALLYLRAVFGVLFGLLFSPIGLVVVVGAAAAGLGINNEKRWGWKVGVAVAVLQLLPLVLIVEANGLLALLRPDVLISFVFDIALFALLVHPQSRAHQKIWFS